MRLYCVWNRSYNSAYYLAESFDEALEFAHKAKHVRRAGAYRRYADLTDTVADIPGSEEITALIEANNPGILRQVEGHWELVK